MAWCIPEADIERVKCQTDLVALVQSRGVELKKHGAKDWIGRCPFHEDNQMPNFIVTPDLALVVRSGEGLLRRTRNLCLSSLIEAVRDQIRVVDLKQVNRVLIQPHWRKDCDQPIA
jgi:hypothetical protein